MKHGIADFKYFLNFPIQFHTLITGLDAKSPTHVLYN